MLATPNQLNYRFPAEWEKHEATWLSWPHNQDTWPGKIDQILSSYAKFIEVLSNCELVRINVNNAAMQAKASEILTNHGLDLGRIEFYNHTTNDAWCRDHGPSFLINETADSKKVIVNWEYNAWGGKYPPFEQDNQIPSKIAESLGLPIFNAGIVMEGGSVDFNGDGTLITTTSCLLNKNRNPRLNKEEIEQKLIDYYGVKQILWLNEGIEGDDTDGHIDDITRFINKNTVVSVVEHNANDLNYNALNENIKELQKMKLEDGSSINIVELPMPSPVIYNNQRLPASYANFYICNDYVIVPTFNDKMDDKALDIIQGCFDSKEVIGINSVDIIWGLGSFHCLSQQEPEI